MALQPALPAVGLGDEGDGQGVSPLHLPDQDGLHLVRLGLGALHDELIVECPETEADQVKTILVREMEGAYPLSVPLIAEAHSGKSWLECH